MNALRKIVYITYAIILTIIMLAALLGAKEGVIVFLLLIWFGFIAVMELAYWVEGEE